MRARKRESYLISRIPIQSRLKSSMDQVRASLESYPHMRLLQSGEQLRYLLQVESLEDRFYTFSFCSDSIVLELHSKTSPHYFLQESMLRLLSVMLPLADDYEFSAASIFPYLIELLGRERIRHYAEAINEGRSQGSSDIVLASRINSLLKANSELKLRCGELEVRARKAVSCLILAKYGSNASIDGVARENGLDRQEILSALEFMPELGYRVIRDNQNRFSLVRL